MISFAFFHGEREKYPTGSAWADLKIRNVLLIDFSGKKEFLRVIAYKSLITELHNGQPIVEGFKGGFLPFATEHVPKDKDRLALTLDAEILQRSLGNSDPRELTGRAGSNPRHTGPIAKISPTADLTTD